MGHYKCQKTYIPKKRAERISDKVDFFPKQCNMPKMSSTDTTFHATQDLIYSLHNKAPENPLAKLGNGHKESLRTLAEIFSKSRPPSIPLRVPVR